MGLKSFQTEVDRRLGYKLQPIRPFNFTSNADGFVWVTGEDGRHHYTKVRKGDFKLTANQHIIISNVTDRALPGIKRLIAEYKLNDLNHSVLRSSSPASVVFPTCGMFRISPNPYKNYVDRKRCVAFRARHGRIRTCTCTVGFQYLTPSPDLYPVFTGVDRGGGICGENGLRNDSIVNHAHDRMSQWLCSALSWRWVSDALGAWHKRIC